MIWEKIFREPFFGNKRVKVKLVSYLKGEIPYYTFIKQQKKENYKQIIISSELMLKLMDKTILEGGEILKVTLSEKNDQEFQEKINLLVEDLRLDKECIDNLKQELSWVIGDQSIDISELKILYNNVGVSITSDGILYGSEVFEIVNHLIIIPTVEDYVNG